MKLEKKRKFFKNTLYSKTDIYYRKAKEEGYRARSAYKLLQIDDEFKIFQNVTRAVDLCSAPGSWSQVLSNKLYKSDEERKSTDQLRVVSVDLQEMAPIDGVAIIQGDITTQQTLDKILGVFKGEKAELVVSDGAPDVTGFHEIDQYLQAQLLQAALTITQNMLREGGIFVAKFFKSSDLSYLYVMMKQIFRNVYVVKPQSSRASSAEAFVIGLSFIENSSLVLSDSMKTLSSYAHNPQTVSIKEENKEEEDEDDDDVLTF
ncbi:ribosomal rna methyltransferase [Stylonychia lemnae]|uniref:Ribosomal rna methyltransferase n=1 Tax=Stylonychia lemnae TaxID=5949 RepID=A0A078AFA7_STYLE|nr:ribosomal rna methyltransferase [Stylonychia lemnae]|eukprot:CDW79603.1 ribosomal rna methyltransferase [Stylonychia lemnae]